MAQIVSSLYEGGGHIEVVEVILADCPEVWESMYIINAMFWTQKS